MKQILSCVIAQFKGLPNHFHLCFLFHFTKVWKYSWSSILLLLTGFIGHCTAENFCNSWKFYLLFFFFFSQATGRRAVVRVQFRPFSIICKPADTAVIPVVILKQKGIIQACYCKTEIYTSLSFSFLYFHVMILHSFRRAAKLQFSIAIATAYEEHY